MSSDDRLSYRQARMVWLLFPTHSAQFCASTSYKSLRKSCMFAIKGTRWAGSKLIELGSAPTSR